MAFNEKFIDRNIAELCQAYDCICGANKNIARIASDVIDGNKPVHRRILISMFLVEQGKTYRKSASITGEVIGHYHPHGEDAVYESMCKLSQPWMMSIPLIESDSNMGSVAGDPPAARRYTKARLSEYAQACFFEDWKDSVVDMVPAFDGKHMEPAYLPAKYPNVLLNGCLGIGYGVASNIPPFNFKELINATIQLMIDPNANIILIPDSPTGCDVIETDFARICERGAGSYQMRCTYEIDPDTNSIRITTLPLKITANSIREKIADIKEKGGLPELLSMADMSGINIDIRLMIREDVNPYKFMKKLIQHVPGLESSYPVNVTVTNERKSVDYTVKETLQQWITWRREQKRTVIVHKKNRLLEEQRTNDVKLFVMSKENLEKTINIFRSGRNRAAIEQKLVETYHKSPIRMDSLQAHVLSDMKFSELCEEAYDACVKRRDELIKEIAAVDETMTTENGIDKLIIAELRDGSKRFGIPRRSNVVPAEISVDNKIEGACIMQLSSDGKIVRHPCTNVYEEPIPTDTNGFAVRVDNDSTFILIDDMGYHSFVKVAELPVDSEVPVNRYSKQTLNGNIVAMLPVDIDSDICCTLVSKKGQLKRIRVADMGPSKKPCIDLADDDKLVRGVVTKIKSQKDLLVYTKNGMGQRFDPNSIRTTSPNAKGGNGFKLDSGDEIIGCYAINPEENSYLLYVTSKGKFRLNNLSFLPTRDSKHDAMVSLITLNDRDKLVSIIGCNKLDSVQVFFDDGTNEVIKLETMTESTMSSPAVKLVNKNMVTNSVVKAKLL